MSHVTKIDMMVQDLGALRTAAEALGLEWREGQKTHAWYGRDVGDSNLAGDRDRKTFGTCEHAIGIPGTVASNGPTGSYEIGVAANKAGTGYDVVYDAWGPGRQLEQLAGAGLGRLKQEYSAAVIMQHEAAMARRGFVTTRENVAGRVLISMRKR